MDRAEVVPKGKLTLYLNPNLGTESAVFSEMFETDRRAVETCPPESRGPVAGQTASCKDCNVEKSTVLLL